MAATAAAVVLIVLMLPVLRPRNAKVRMPTLDHQPERSSPYQRTLKKVIGIQRTLSTPSASCETKPATS